MQGESADEKTKQNTKQNKNINFVWWGGEGVTRGGDALRTAKTLTERGEKKVAGNFRVGWDGERHCV